MNQVERRDLSVSLFFLFFDGYFDSFLMLAASSLIDAPLSFLCDEPISKNGGEEKKRGREKKNKGKRKINQK